MTLKKLRSAVLALAMLAPIVPAQAAWAQDCDPAPDPILTLDYGSRYTDDSENRSDIDVAGNAAVDEALDPVDTFLRDLTRMANDVPLEDARTARLAADCVLSQIATWAEADALGDLQSTNANLTVGSRIAGFGLVMLQVLPYTSNTSYLRDIRPWLAGLMADQMLFWEETAPPGAKRGNLRAWSALAGATVGIVTNDPIIESWAVASTAYVMCTAAEDGSLPQEMSRGKLALHYQLHAIAPLTVTAALLAREGVDLTGHCDYALQRIVDFAIDDLNNAGAASEAITGEPQSLFDGTRELKNWQLAWLEAYGTVHYDPRLRAMTESLRPLSYSKLGGDQTLVWAGLQF